MRPCHLLACFAGTVLVALPAGAEETTKPYPTCTTQATEGDVAAAKGAFSAGTAAYNEADYERAITYWEDAFRRDCTASALLLNLSRAYELKGSKKQALLCLQTYNEREPASPQRDQIMRRIEKLEEQIKADSAPPPTGPQTGPAKPPPETQPPPEAPAEPADDEPRRPLLPLFVAGGGAIITIVGGILYLGAKGDVSDFESQCPPNDKGDPTCPSDAVTADANSARSSAQLTGWITVGGIAITAGGVVWYFLQEPHKGAGIMDVKKEPRQALRFTPSLVPGFAGGSLSGSF